MDLYALAKPLLFALEPEYAHEVALRGLKALHRARTHLGYADRKIAAAPVQLLGLQFPNRIGLAAGADKNGRFIDALGGLGFGFIEIGTITPRPQAGRPKPRLFRLVKDAALINRLGFPNDGVKTIAERIAARSYRGVLGANISVNAQTPIDSFADDFVECFRGVHRFVDYITINVSSPNTADLRGMQDKARLSALFERLQEERAAVLSSTGRSVPILIKLSPDLTDAQLHEVATTAMDWRIDGIVAVNTTTSRNSIEGNALAREAGGLSGQPLKLIARRTVARLRCFIGDDILIVGVGGISNADDYCRMREAGADLVQVYTGLVYRGPRLIREVQASEFERGSRTSSVEPRSNAPDSAPPDTASALERDLP